MSVSILAGNDAFLRTFALKRLARGRKMLHLKNPKTLLAILTFLREGHLAPVFKVILTPKKLGRQKEIAAQIQGYECAIITDDSPYQLKNAFWRSFKGKAEFVDCSPPRSWGEDLNTRIMQLADSEGVVLDPDTLAIIRESCGADLGTAHSDIRKLKYVTERDPAFLELIFWTAQGFSLDIGAFVRGNVAEAVAKARYLEPFQIAWRIIDYMVRLLEFHQIYEDKGTLEGRVQRALVNKYESELRYFPESRVLASLKTFSDLLPFLRRVPSHGILWKAMYDCSVA